jgi:hypothetical protein
MQQMLTFVMGSLVKETFCYWRFADNQRQRLRAVCRVR